MVLSQIVISGFETPSFKNEWRFVEGNGGNINGTSISFPTAYSMTRTLSSIPNEFEACFFEVLVIKGFKDAEKSRILLIGFNTKDTRIPGIDRNTAAYVSKDGNGSIRQDGEILKEVEGISQGDTIRCNLEFIRICGQTITCYTFFKNGKVISARRYITSNNVYPTIMVNGEGLEVETTFGTIKNNFEQGM